MFLTAYSLFRTLSSVTLSTEHLAVFYDCSATLSPRSDMVALHKLVVELLATDKADVVLLLPYGKFYILRKGSQVKVVLITCQYVRYDALPAVYGGGKHSWRLRGDFTLRKENGRWKLSSSGASTY